MATESRWRILSRQAIAKALAVLPANATYAQAKTALFAAYPFGQREHLPYKMWCEEQRAALEKFPHETTRAGIPAWYEVRHGEQERAFLDAIRFNSCDRANMGVYGDWLMERGDGRGEGWVLLCQQKHWPLQERSKWYWRALHSSAMLFRPPHELPAEVYGCLVHGGNTTQHGSKIGGSWLEQYHEYRAAFHACCDFAAAWAKRNEAATPVAGPGRFRCRACESWWLLKYVSDEKMICLRCRAEGMVNGRRGVRQLGVYE